MRLLHGSSADYELCPTPNLLDCPFSDQPALADDPNPGADLFDLPEEVTGEENRPVTLPEPLNQVAELGQALRIEAIGRPIEGEYLTLLKNPHRHAPALLHHVPIV